MATEKQMQGSKYRKRNKEKERVEISGKSFLETVEDDGLVNKEFLKQLSDDFDAPAVKTYYFVCKDIIKKIPGYSFDKCLLETCRLNFDNRRPVNKELRKEIIKNKDNSKDFVQLKAISTFVKFLKGR